MKLADEVLQLHAAGQMPHPRHARVPVGSEISVAARALPQVHGALVGRQRCQAGADEYQRQCGVEQHHMVRPPVGEQQGCAGRGQGGPQRGKPRTAVNVGAGRRRAPHMFHKGGRGHRHGEEAGRRQGHAAQEGGDGLFHTVCKVSELIGMGKQTLAAFGLGRITGKNYLCVSFSTSCSRVGGREREFLDDFTKKCSYDT